MGWMWKLDRNGPPSCLFTCGGVLHNGAYYYYHVETQRTEWNMPEEAKAVDGLAGMMGAASLEGGDDDLHEEYAWAFVLHNLVPFADKLLGIAGAMDQRPLSIYDWPLRLPFIVWAAARPSSQMALTVAHVMNVIFWAARMPAVWDYMCWVALTDCGPDTACVRAASKVSLRMEKHRSGGIELGELASTARSTNANASMPERPNCDRSVDILSIVAGLASHIQYQ